MNGPLGNVSTTDSRPSVMQFCSICGADYVLRMLTLYQSLNAQYCAFCLWIGCIDRIAFDTLSRQNLTNAKLFLVSDMEDDALLAVRSQRALNEYCWTLKAPLMEYLLVSQSLDHIVYCDGDLYFFSDPTALFDEWGTQSIYLCPQRDLLAVEAVYGTYQAGLIGFKHDDIGLAALRWWKDECLSWCFGRTELGRFGDQKYLDEFPEHFSQITISAHGGIDAAPWNLIFNPRHQFIGEHEGSVYLDHEPLIVYHFACLDVFQEDLFDLWSLHPITVPVAIKAHIYLPYLAALRKQIAILGGDAPVFFSGRDPLSAKSLYKDSAWRREIDQASSYYQFCTLVSTSYLPKLMALYDSLNAHTSHFCLWVAALDEESLFVLQSLGWPHLRLIPLGTLENPDLQHLKSIRSLKEYSWTLKPYLLEYILTHHLEVDALLYLDADLYFFADPAPIFKAWGEYSMCLCTQRAPAEVEFRHGIYQAGLIGFRREPNSLQILRAWRDKCREWCFDQFDAVALRWGDQKYLDYIPNIFSNVKVIRDAGINAAPWNLAMTDGHPVTRRGEQIYIDDAPLICYHFGSLNILDNACYDLWSVEPLSFQDSLIDQIYTPYLVRVQQMQQQLYHQFPDIAISDNSLTPFHTPAMNPFQITDSTLLSLASSTKNSPVTRSHRWPPWKRSHQNDKSPSVIQRLLRVISHRTD